jgi:hypothetical protein
MKPLTPQPDPTKARTPHRRQAFTQLPQGSKNMLRELNRQRTMRTSGPCSEVRIGKRLPDGTTIWYDPDAEQLIRQEERANEELERRERKARLQAIVSGQAAEIDSWANKQ